MEHIVQFAIGIDDNAIQKLCEEKAAKQVLDDIKEFSHGWSYYGNGFNDTPVCLKELFVAEIRNYVHEHADEVMQAAVQEVARGMTKSKKFREAVESITKEEQDG